MLHFKVEIHVPALGLLHGNAKCISNCLPVAECSHGTPFIRFSLNASTCIGQRIEPADQGPHLKFKQTSAPGQEDAVTGRVLLEDPARPIQAKNMALPERVIICAEIDWIRG